MKNRLKFIALVALSFSVAACRLDPQGDDYAPNAQIEGDIIVTGTGDSAYDGQRIRGGEGVIRVREDSWEIEGTPPWREWKLMAQDLNDISFRNTKVWAGEYTVYPYQGAYYPFKEEEGWTKLSMKRGKNVVNFEVTPFALIDWVEEPHLVPSDHPTLTSGMMIECSVRYKRLAPPSYTTPEIIAKGTPVPLQEHWISFSVSKNRWMTANDDQYTPAPSGDNENPANASYDPYPARTRVFTFGTTDDKEGQIIVLRTSIPLKYQNTTYYVRADVNVGGSSVASGYPTRKNFTTIVPVVY